jgi:hypothetical protein
VEQRSLIVEESPRNKRLLGTSTTITTSFFTTDTTQGTQATWHGPEPWVAVKAYIPQGRSWFVLSFFFPSFLSNGTQIIEGFWTNNNQKPSHKELLFLLGSPVKGCIWPLWPTGTLEWKQKKKMKETAAAAFWRCYFALTVSVQRNRSMWLVQQLSFSDRQ